ncbi:MAG TPA: hypothetical protein DCE08_02610 [Ruminococcaceae bacterium]|nr:hypothetical protein [Oscillospiraceae bacterium]
MCDFFLFAEKKISAIFQKISETIFRSFRADFSAGFGAFKDNPPFFTVPTADDRLKHTIIC